jgi:hypothetical protein
MPFINYKEKDVSVLTVRRTKFTSLTKRLSDFSEQCCKEKSGGLDVIPVRTGSVDFLHFSFLCSVSKMF